MPAEYLLVNQPDILEVIANLSNDAVFTPPRVVNAVLDLLPAEVWIDPSLRWLDPGAKTGVFPREITKRLMVGLVDAIPDEEARLEHILTEMVFAIATEEITGMMSRRSLYCSKDASSQHSVAAFAATDGNVWWKRVKHSWDSEGRCTECKGNREQLLQPGRDNKAYGFIHADGRKQIDKEMDMKFDVIVGNPPYQMDDDGGHRPVPIYNKFVEQAIELNPQYIAMIIPSRWMGGGLGLSSFRNAMLTDQRIRRLVDFTKMEEVFPGVDFEGGVCYFLWDRDNPGSCTMTLHRDGVVVGPYDRDLNQHDILVRDLRALPILEKVVAGSSTPFSELVASVRPFGDELRSNFKGFTEHRAHASNYKLYMNEGGRRREVWVAKKYVTKNEEIARSWKVLVPTAYGERGMLPARVLGPSQVVAPDSVCTETYLAIGPFATEVEAKSALTYLQTRLVRFIVSLRKVAQHNVPSTFVWVPQQSWNRTWTDADLYKIYGITADEQAYIDAMVKEVEG